MDKFYLDEKNLLENFISKKYLPNIFSKQKNLDWELGEGIQLIIRPQCNQKCKYCYITNYGDKLYPVETRISNDEILKNIKINKVFIPQYEIFAGDLFADKLYYKILDTFLEVFAPISKKHLANVQRWKMPVILTPVNGWFFKYEEHRNLIREYKQKLHDTGFALAMSWSTDGLYAAEARENAIDQGHMTQEDYDIIFPFIKEMNFGIHAMISAETIKNSIKNYDWWIEM